MREKVRLIYTEGSSNKFYEMEERPGDPGKFYVSYGRIENRGGQVADYHISLWDKKYKEKINKGYKDVSTTIKKFSLDDIFANLDKLEERLKAQ